MKQMLLRRLFFRKNTGPRLMPEYKLPPLAACILMDLLGCASFALPFVGEVFDIVWAPVSAAIFMRMFGGAKGLFGGIFNFVEELLPGLDFIPTFTIAWLYQYLRRPRAVKTMVVTNAR